MIDIYQPAKHYHLVLVVNSTEMTSRLENGIVGGPDLHPLIFWRIVHPYIIQQGQHLFSIPQ